MKGDTCSKANHGVGIYLVKVGGVINSHTNSQIGSGDCGIWRFGLEQMSPFVRGNTLVFAREQILTSPKIKMRRTDKMIHTWYMSFTPSCALLLLVHSLLHVGAGFRIGFWNTYGWLSHRQLWHVFYLQHFQRQSLPQKNNNTPGRLTRVLKRMVSWQVSCQPSLKIQDPLGKMPA